MSTESLKEVKQAFKVLRDDLCHRLNRFIETSEKLLPEVVHDTKREERIISYAKERYIEFSKMEIYYINFSKFYEEIQNVISFISLALNELTFAKNSERFSKRKDVYLTHPLYKEIIN